MHVTSLSLHKNSIILIEGRLQAGRRVWYELKNTLNKALNKVTYYK